MHNLVEPTNVLTDPRAKFRRRSGKVRSVFSDVEYAVEGRAEVAVEILCNERRTEHVRDWPTISCVAVLCPSLLATLESQS